MLEEVIEGLARNSVRGSVVIGRTVLNFLMDVPIELLNDTFIASISLLRALPGIQSEAV